MLATTSTGRVEANRRNAERSTGPRTAEGKGRSRLNALKHALTAAIPVLPGEDADALRARVDAWKRDVRPRGPMETYLVERAAHASWQLERAERTIAARLKEAMGRDAEDRAHDEADEAARLARRLLGDPRDPARLVDRLGRTACGCRWLLDRWGELRRILDDGRKWGPPDRLRAVRLLGRHPVDALHDDRVLSIYLACGAMSPNDPREYDDLCSALAAGGRERSSGHAPYAGTVPEDPEAGRALLRAIVDEDATRIEARLRVHQVQQALDCPGRLDRLAFDDTDEGERLRRYQLAHGRAMLRAINAVFQVRRETEADRDGAAAGCRGEAPEASPPAGETRPFPPDTPVSLPFPPSDATGIAAESEAPALAPGGAPLTAGSPLVRADETKPIAEGPSSTLPQDPCSEGRHLEPATDPGPPIRPACHAALSPMLVRLVREAVHPSAIGGGSAVAPGDLAPAPAPS